MKKLKLKSNAFQGNALSREQLKKVLGGVTGSDTGSDGCPSGQFKCTCSSDTAGMSGCVSSLQQCWDAC